MKLRTNATLFVLRTTARLAWALADLSRSLADTGKNLEGVVDRLAMRWCLDIADVLDPLVTKRSAG